MYTLERNSKDERFREQGFHKSKKNKGLPGRALIYEPNYYKKTTLWQAAGKTPDSSCLYLYGLYLMSPIMNFDGRGKRGCEFAPYAY